jgi:predicted NAD-dependent protein-ADP-ribosyltransferase YbiA (DUF1768 family)
MEVDGVQYVTCEQYMMASRARLFGDAEDDPRITQMELWGLNLLGNALMRVRETLRGA